METKKYSAGMVKLSFWFAEFRKVLDLLDSGKTMNEIRLLSKAENIFGSPTTARGVQIFNTVSTRVKRLDKGLLEIFKDSDITAQKIIALISIMNVDNLFFDFIYEVYREKLILGIDVLEDSDYGVFFNNKQLQNERAAKWTDATLANLKKAYKTIIMESGLTNNSRKSKKITKPILDVTLEHYLRANGMEIYIKALTGVR